MLTLVIFLAVLALLIAGHEFGHFLAAKTAGITVEEFAIGFGPRILAFRLGETVYSLRAVPIGGFNRFSGMDPAEGRRAGPRDFLGKPPGTRVAVISAGPVMNLVIGVALFALVYGPVGLPTFHLAGSEIGKVLPGYPAAAANLRGGDQIMAIDGRPVADWSQLVRDIESDTRPLTLRVRRGDRFFTVRLTPVADPATGRRVIGISPPVAVVHRPWLAALVGGLRETDRIVSLWFTTIWGAFRHERLPQVGGPVMIGEMVGQAARSGLSNVLLLTGFLSVQLAIINLLPLPALDGSRLLFLGLEGVRLKVNPDREEMIHFVGFVFLILLMILVTFHDLVRIGVG